MKYAEDQDAFFKDYAEAHLKLSELGKLLFLEVTFLPLHTWKGDFCKHATLKAQNLQNERDRLWKWGLENSWLMAGYFYNPAGVDWAEEPFTIC